MLNIKDLSIHYGPFLACDKVNLDVPFGTIIGLVGPNGAGKSSITKAIMGLVKEQHGEVLFENQPITGIPTHQLVSMGIALVPEGRGLFPQMSVEENLLMGSYSLKSNSRKQELFERCFELFPILKERQKQLVGTMSGGQQQMVAISVGLMSDPKLIIFDEPSLGLAPIVISEIGQTLKKLLSLHLTVLLVEQNAKLASGIADQIYVISAGKILYHNTPQNLLNNQEIMEKFLSH